MMMTKMMMTTMMMMTMMMMMVMTMMMMMMMMQVHLTMQQHASAFHFLSASINLRPSRGDFHFHFQSTSGQSFFTFNQPKTIKG